MALLLLVSQISPPVTALHAASGSGGSGFSIPSVVGIVLGIIGVVGVVAAAVAVVRSNLAQTTIALYREESNALRQRNETLEQERDEAQEEAKAEKTKRVAAEHALEDMKDMVQGTSAIKELSKAVERQHHDMSAVMEAQHTETMDGFDTLAAGLAAWATHGTPPPPKISNGGHD